MRTSIALALLLAFAAPELARAQPTLPPARAEWDGRSFVARTRFDQDFERLVIKFREGTGVRVRSGRLAIDSRIGPRAGTPARSRLAAELAAIERKLQESGLRPAALFSSGEAALDRSRQRAASRSGKLPADLNLYAGVPLPNRGRGLPLSSLCLYLTGLESVEVAYPESFTTGDDGPPVQGPSDEAQAGITPLYVGEQGYLAAAPDGIDAFSAWESPGGTGEGVRVVAIDSGVNADHEDLPDLVVSDGPGTSDWNTAHGTATMGVVGARHNGSGLKGIAYDAEIGSRRAPASNVSDEIQEAADQLEAGDVLLLETAYALDGWDCPCNPDQAGRVAHEYVPARFDAIQTAVLAGITVVEVGGNGCVDYDDPSFDGWFDPAVQDSGAIVVGADLSSAREPICYSPYGERIDLHAWAENVACLELLREDEEPIFDGGPNRLYGPNFGGTSSAAAIVAGAVASLQGAAMADDAWGQPLEPEAVRALLVETGTPQTDDLDRPIGPMPDLAAAFAELGL